MNAPERHLHAPDGAASRPPLRREDFAHIPGWGADLDKADRPACPMEHMPPRLDVTEDRRFPAQQPRVDVLHSNERPGLTPLFGTSAPPSGLSGGLRRVAFKFSENDLRHWLLLLAADRVNMVEGLVGDLAHGHVPNIYAEVGGPAAVRHNPAGVARKALALTALAAVAIAVYRRPGAVKRRALS